MLRNSQNNQRRTQKVLTTLLSVSLTTFLLGGMVMYLATAYWAPDGAAAGGADSGADAKSKRRGPVAQLVRVGKVERKSIVPVRTLVGDLIAVRRATIATEVAGKIVELPVDEGTRVVGGKTLLARIDSTWTKLENDKITTQIAENSATLTFEKSDLQRLAGLLRNNAVSISEVEQKRAMIEGLEASLAQLNVLQEEAQERISRLDILAPFDGSVVMKNAEVGEYVSVGSPIVEIVSTGRIDAQIMVPEESLPLIAVGDSIEVIIDSMGMKLQGRVFSINSQGSVGSRTFPVRLEIDDQGGTLLPGMGVSAFVPVRKESTELLVPRDAVLMKPDESTVWVLQANDESNSGDNQQSPTWVAQPLPVRVLSHTRDAYAIVCERESDRERLAPGVQVVTEGLERLIPGAQVRVDADRSTLEAVPGTFRTGQQITN